jgi:two-component system, chemotaxis family, sensor kinase Cph1
MNDMVAITGGVDLTTCEREPIHIPGSIQPHGILFVLHPESLEIRQLSANAAEVIGGEYERALGLPLSRVLPEGAALTAGLRGVSAERTTAPLQTLAIGPETYHVFASRSDGQLIVEFERAGAAGGSFEHVYPQMRSFVEELQSAPSDDVLTLAARQVREITGFDRALIYKFDRDWNGTVMAEDRNDVLPSYLDLRFPASDIPRQARELYRLNRIRLIPDADYTPVPIVAAAAQAGRPVDLTYSVLRSVSPVHLEYMKNMGTAASMSISIIVDGNLWGLISCHNKAPRHASPAVRNACDFVAQILALQIASQEKSGEAAHRLELRAVQSELLAHMAAEERFIEGLTKHADGLLRMAEADGAAVVFDGECALIGRTPSEADVRRILQWLTAEGQEDLFVTESLASVMPDAEPLKDTASGLLAIAISKLHASYVIWFRPEVIQTVKWGGDPRKPVDPTPDGPRLHPRKSFDLWKETVRLASAPWRASEVETARDLRSAIVGIVLRKAEEVADLVAELERSNKELESFSYSVSHDLRAPFRHIVGFAELLRESAGGLDDTQRRYVETIIESAFSAGRLVDDLLSFSQMGRASLLPISVDMARLVQDVRRTIEPETNGRPIEWRIGDLGRAYGDPIMLRLVLQNLLSNAVKYTRSRQPAVIELGLDKRPGENVYFVRDNGVGFDMTYVGKLFGVFQRLHRVDEFEGTGIGLANVRRIVERHGGRTWAEGALDAGATFYFSLPTAPSDPWPT